MALFSVLIIISVLELVVLIAMPLLFDNGAVFPNMSDDIFSLLYISCAIVFCALPIFFLGRALKAGIMAPWENNKWRYEIYTALVDISIRRNNKKLKFWYDKDQLKQIENLVKSASKNAEVKLEANGNKVVSFTVIDTVDNRVIFTGLFI